MEATSVSIRKNAAQPFPNIWPEHTDVAVSYLSVCPMTFANYRIPRKIYLPVCNSCPLQPFA